MTPEREKELVGLVKTGSQTPTPKGARCTRCQKVIREDGHNAFCSSDCAEAERVEVSQQRLRDLLFDRDHAVCAECGIDCEALRDELDALLAANRAELARAHAIQDFVDARALRRLSARVHQLVILGFPRKDVEDGKTLWNAAHVDARVKGGPTTLANAKTLCLACHRKDTNKLAGERASARKVGGKKFPKRRMRRG